jgi:hypothetical protein
MGAVSGGSVSMVFTDIESSTQLLLSLRERYVESLEMHRRVLRRAWTALEGREMGTEGDSFFVVFESPTAAVHACLQAQRDLASQDWPAQRAVRVRMGVHTGNPMPHGDGFVGPTCIWLPACRPQHTAARLSSRGLRSSRSPRCRTRMDEVPTSVGIGCGVSRILFTSTR